jgi:Protein of unknown function (DUF3727)/Protein of unknown function (DUF1292)
MTAEMDAPTVLLNDDEGRSLLCYIEQELDINGTTYGLLLPVDTPINIFTWPIGDSDDEDPTLVEDEEEMATIFPIARAVLAEQNLTLLQTAVTLTVEGDLPDLEEEDEDEDEPLEGDTEEFELLATFFNEEQEYAIYTPMDPFLVVVRLEDGVPKLLSQEEFMAVEPLIEECLADEEYDDNDN